MIFDPKYPIFIFNSYIDMRKGHNSLSHLVTYQMDHDLLSGSLFLFVARNRKSTKAIFFDGNGLVVVHKKLERGRFMSFDDLAVVTENNSNELTLILIGGQIPLSKSGKKISLTK